MLIYYLLSDLLAEVIIGLSEWSFFLDSLLAWFFKDTFSSAQGRSGWSLPGWTSGRNSRISWFFSWKLLAYKDEFFIKLQHIDTIDPMDQFDQDTFADESEISATLAADHECINRTQVTQTCYLMWPGTLECSGHCGDRAEWKKSETQITI